MLDLVCKIFGHWWQYGMLDADGVVVGRTRECRVCGEFHEEIDRPAWRVDRDGRVHTDKGPRLVVLRAGSAAGGSPAKTLNNAGR